MEIQGYNMPDDLYYHAENSWVKVESDGTIRVGMDDFYQKQAGDTTYVDLPFEGDSVSQGETCGNELENDCRLINKDSYNAGWIMRIKPTNLDEELKNLAHGPEAITKFIEDHISKTKGGK
jgi:glycine cleavage system H protein